MQIFVVAGEASGDRHAAGVVAALKARRPDLTFFGMGGERLEAEGVELVHGSHEISVMGITEVLPKIPRILKVLDDLATAAKRRKPAAALLVDVPDFNLRLAKRLKASGIPVAWYISPMVWAWRPGRVKAIASRVDRMLCILPFEEDFYRGTNVRAQYVGNPLVEQVPAPAEPAVFRRALGLPEAGRYVAMLPGSRPSEVARILPTLIDAARRIDAKPIVAVAPGLQLEFPGAHLVQRRAAEVVGASDVAVVASGTATLEAGLMQRPLVVVYRLAPVSYLVGRAMVKLEHFSLVNLLAGRTVVPELLQGGFTADAVVKHVDALWEGPERDAQLAGLAEVRAKLGGTRAAGRAADAVIELLKSR